MLGRLPVLAILVALLAAGCVSSKLAPASTKDATSGAAIDGVRPDVQVPKFLAPVLLGTVTLGSEPSVAVAPDGTVYVASPSVGAWRSDDQGKTYKALGKQACGFGLPACPVTTENDANGMDDPGDASIFVAPNGTVWSAGLAGKAGSIPMQFSADKGASWSKGYDAAKKNSSDREWVVTNKTGAVFVSWRDFGRGSDTKCTDPVGLMCSGPPASLMMAYLAPGTTMWSDPVRVAEDGHEGPIATDPSSDIIYLPHAVTGKSVFVARSLDGGRTWTDTKVAPIPVDTYDFPIATVDSAGTVYVVWSVDPNQLDDMQGGSVSSETNIPQVMLSKSTDHGVTWSKPLQISPKGVPAIFPWAVAGAPGRLAVAWYEGTTPTPGDRAPNVWHVAVTESTTADTDAPKFAEGFVSSDPNHVGPICTEGGLCTLTGNDRSLLDFFEIRLLPDGSPVLAFVGDNDVHMATVKIYATRMTSGTTLGPISS